MVIDNADDSQLFYPRNQGDDNTELQKGGLGRYIPTCALGSILITTRNKRAAVDLAPGQQPIDIGAMTGEEAGQLIRSKLDGFEISSDDALSLAMQLEYLPLAIGQAVAYIFKNSISVEKYLQMLQNSDNDLVTLLRREFVVGDQNADIPRSLASTWIISFQQIQRQDVFASEVLSLISLFHRQAIPQEFVNSYWHLRQSQNDKTVLKRKWEESTMGEEASVTEALGTLKAFAFISEGTDETVTMHRLVQLVMRNWLLEKDRLAKLVDQSVQILAGAFPISTHENRELCVRYLVHASAVLHASDTDPQDDIEARILLLGRLGYYHYYWNRWEDAEIYQRRVTELNIQVRGGEHSETLESIRHLGFTIMMQEGRTAEAKELLEETFRTQKRLLGEEHPGTLYAMELFARALLEEGIFNEAEALLRQAVEMTREENLLDTLSAIDGLALALVMQGRLKEAEELLRQVLGDFKRVVGEQHIDTTKLAGALADVLSDQGRFEESSRLMVQALETMKRVYGDEHPDTIEAMNGLAHTRRKLGHLGEALDLMRSCISLKVKVYGSNHKETIYGLEFLVDWEAEWKAEREADSETDPEADPEVV